MAPIVADTQADIEAQIEEQKHQHYSTGNTKDKQIFNHLSIGATAGLDAFGLEVAAPVTPFLQLRGGYSFMPRISTNATYNNKEESFKLSDNRTVTIPANHKFPLTLERVVELDGLPSQLDLGDEVLLKVAVREKGSTTVLQSLSGEVLDVDEGSGLVWLKADGDGTGIVLSF